MHRKHQNYIDMLQSIKSNFEQSDLKRILAK